MHRFTRAGIDDEDDQAIIWDTATGRAIRRLHHPRGEEAWFLSAAWSPDGNAGRPWWHLSVDQFARSLVDLGDGQRD
jgi:hypothetical protein